SPQASGSSAPAPSASAPASAIADVAFVPVTSFRTGLTTTRPADVSGIPSGTSPFASLVLVKADAASQLAALGIDATALGNHLVTAPSADALMTTLAKHPTWLGFLRADQVGPGVRALAWGTASLFGETRVASLAAWPLQAQLPATTGATAYDPANAWTLYAAGDLGLDRGAALAIKNHGNNPNYLYDGGTVTITGHCKDCSQFGWDLPYTKRTGNAGAVRALIKGADFAIANMEEVAVKNFTFHPHGTVFTGNPAYLAGVRDAGFDWVSMGNNHVGDFGPAGVLQSMNYLTQYGLLHGGAGANTTAAHQPSIVTIHGVKVALLSYDTVAPVYNATATKAGSARMTAAWLKKDIKAARDAGAQVVIVWPHWGVEYTAGPSQTQQTLAHAAIDAGADLVIGNHPHWAQAMEVYKGHPIWYALGNFTFDQTWSEPTMEGISLEFTFSGSRLVQVWLHPHLVIDWAQPNFMDPAGSGKVVLNQIFKASKNLPW
ncbi:MAG TPA: CapA family protein, partial [Candidatus Limnocylindrales bacterium]